MLRRIGLFGLTLLLAGCARSKDAPERPPDGAWLYQRSCAGCHGGNGKGGARPFTGVLAPDLTVSKLDDAAARRLIRDGKNQMPPFAKLLTDAEVDAILRHLQALKEAAPKQR